METYMKLNISSIKQYLTCQKKAYYLHDLKRAKGGPPPRALLVGTIWHEVMEARFKPGPQRSPEAIIFDSLTEWSPHYPKLVKECDADLKGLMVGYHHWQPPVDWQIHKLEEVITAPVPRWFSGIVSAHQLMGIVDMLIKWNDKWWHVQHKTVDKRKDLVKYWSKMERDWHECGYEYILGRAGLDAPYGGTLLITAKKLGEKDALARPGDVITHQFISRPQHVVDKAVDDIYYIMEEWSNKLDFARVAGGPAQFVENLDACYGVYGNSKCIYHDVCHAKADIHGPEFITITDRYEDVVETN